MYHVFNDYDELTSSFDRPHIHIFASLVLVDADIITVVVVVFRELICFLFFAARVHSTSSSSSAYALTIAKLLNHQLELSQWWPETEQQWSTSWMRWNAEVEVWSARGWLFFLCCFRARLFTSQWTWDIPSSGRTTLLLWFISLRWGEFLFFREKWITRAKFNTRSTESDTTTMSIFKDRSVDKQNTHNSQSGRVRHREERRVEQKIWSQGEINWRLWASA